MDVSHPIDAVVPTLDGPVLEVLAGATAPMTLTQIATLTQRGSASGVRRVLLRLVHSGVVHALPGGYALNRDHLAAPAVLALASMRTELNTRLSRLVGAWDPPPALVGIFGSYARRDGDADSDIDVLLIDRARNAEARAGELSSHVRTLTGNNCHVVVVTPSQLRRMQRAGERIVTEWTRDLVVVAGDPSVLRPTA